MLEHDQPPAALDDDALTRTLASLLGHEREVVVAFLRHLGELDERRLFLAQGYPSLYAYCRDHLRLSDASAYRRYTAARLMRRFPAIAQFLLDGRLSLTRVSTLREVLTEENHLDLLERATHGTERDVQVLAATLNPKPDVSDGIRKVPALATPAAPPVTPALNLAPDNSPATAPPAGPVAPTAPISPASAPCSNPGAAAPASTTTPLFSSVPPVSMPLESRMEIEPTSARYFAVRMRVGHAFVADFEEVKAALSHKVPHGDFEAVMRECFRITLETLQRRRAGATRKCGTSAETEPRSVATAPAAETPPPSSPRKRASENPDATGAPSTSTSTATSTADRAKSERPSPSRYIPAAVRRAVWSRDGGRCAFVSESGRRCDSTWQVEVHHKDPHARGGPAAEENLSLRCRTHNLYEAEVVFGAGFMRSLPFWKCEDSARPGLQVRTDAEPGPRELQ